MGIFWDLMQQNELNKQQRQAENLEDRVRFLENELMLTKDLLSKTLSALEKHLSQDIDGDGKLG